MLLLVAVPALELSRPVGLRRLRRHLGPERGGGVRSGRALGESGHRGADERHAREEEQPDGAPHVRGAAPGSRAVGRPIGGGSRCLTSVWQRMQSMLCPATWKSWMNGVSG